MMIQINHQVWNNEIKLVFVSCFDSNSSSPILKKDEIINKYKCELFEIGSDKNIKNIDKPFISFLVGSYRYQNEIMKIGKEYKNQLIILIKNI